MWNISIRVSSDQDVRRIVNEIAAVVEQATGERCRVSLVDRRRKQQRLSNMRNNVVQKLKK